MCSPIHGQPAVSDPLSRCCVGIMTTPGCGSGPEVTLAFIAQECPDLPVATCCRVMKVSTSGFCAGRAQPVSERDLDDAYLTNTIVDIHPVSRAATGRPGFRRSRRR
jgi:hypothetical protein